MGKVSHLSLELLSALADDELEPSEELRARLHLAECEGCQLEVAAFALLDARLAAAPAVPCAAALELRSAAFDGAASAAETGIAQAHLSSCQTCRAEEQAWLGLDRALAALPPGMPSAATDARIARLARRPAAVRPRLWPLSPAGVAVGAAVAATLVVALLAGLLPGAPAALDQARPSEPEAAGTLVAAVFHAKSNTLYVLQAGKAAVDAMDATTYTLRTSIVVGGKPTALALSATTDRVFVLDATAKTVTEIDATVNKVVGQTPVGLSGTPTALQVDGTGKVIVTAVVAPPTGPRPAPTPGQTAPPGGQVAIIDTSTKQIVTRTVDVAPRLVVPDPAGKSTLLVSPEGTTMVDASYRSIMTLPGGVGAAFGARGDWFAILSSDGDRSKLTFVGERAPATLSLDGAPAAVTALPDGGLAVLVGVGGKGRVVVIDAEGRSQASIDVAAVGDLDYDAPTERFTIATTTGLLSAALPAGPVALETAVPSAPATAAPGTSAPPSAPVSEVPSASPGSSGPPAPTASPDALPSASAPPSDSLQPGSTPVPTPAPHDVVALPEDVVGLGGGVYRLPVPAGYAPVAWARTERDFWFVDERNGLDVLDLEAGTVSRLAQLPADAHVRGIGVGPEYVYAVDVAKRRLFLLDLRSELLSSRPLPAVDVSAVTVSGGGVLWMAMPGSSQLLSFTPLSKRFETTDVGVSGIVALEAASGSRIWFSSQRTLGYFDTATRRATELAWPGGTPHVLQSGRRGILWVGTTAGEIFLVKDDAATLAFSLRGPVAALALDAAGRPWYLVPELGSGVFSFRPVDPGLAGGSVPGPALDLALDSQGRVWIADPSGGFFLVLSGAR